MPYFALTTLLLIFLSGCNWCVDCCGDDNTPLWLQTYLRQDSAASVKERAIVFAQDDVTLPVLFAITGEWCYSDYPGNGIVDYKILLGTETISAGQLPAPKERYEHSIDITFTTPGWNAISHSPNLMYGDHGMSASFNVVFSDGLTEQTHAFYVHNLQNPADLTAQPFYKPITRELRALGIGETCVAPGIPAEFAFSLNASSPGKTIELLGKDYSCTWTSETTQLSGCTQSFTFDNTGTVSLTLDLYFEPVTVSLEYPIQVTSTCP